MLEGMYWLRVVIVLKSDELTNAKVPSIISKSINDVDTKDTIILITNRKE